MQGLKTKQTVIQTGNYLAVLKAGRSDEVTYKASASGAKATVGADGVLQLNWTKAPTKPVTVTVEASSILDGEIGRRSFQVLPFIEGGSNALMRTGLG